MVLAHALDTESVFAFQSAGLYHKDKTDLALGGYHSFNHSYF
jgi:hypothetical protein